MARLTILAAPELAGKLTLGRTEPLTLGRALPLAVALAAALEELGGGGTQNFWKKEFLKCRI